jgi:MFS family permease
MSSLAALSDRYGFMWPAVISAISMGSGFILVALAPSVPLITFLQGFLIGLGSAATFGPLIADVSLWFYRRRGIAVAVAACGNYFAGAIWPIAMQPMLAAWGWRGTYVCIGVICLATMAPLALMLARRPACNCHRRIKCAAGR